MSFTGHVIRGSAAGQPFGVRAHPPQRPRAAGLLALRGPAPEPEARLAYLMAGVWRGVGIMPLEWESSSRTMVRRSSGERLWTRSWQISGEVRRPVTSLQAVNGRERSAGPLPSGDQVPVRTRRAAVIPRVVIGEGVIHLAGSGEPRYGGPLSRSWEACGGSGRSC